MRARLRLRRFAGLATFVATAAMVLLFVPGALPGVTGAVSTTTNPGVDNGGTGTPVLCLNGGASVNMQPAVNCNIYTDKSYVWLSGLPVQASLGAGTYFFAVLDPGGQNDPNDGSLKNLSSSNDDYAAREFSVDGSGIVTPLGTHDFANNELRLAPYDDTTNPGGVYIMAVCAVPESPTSDLGAPGVDPKDCKYDAFKVKQQTTPPAEDLQVTKDATPSFTRTYKWGIKKKVDNTQVNIADGGSATFNYTVDVTHDGGTDTGWQVTGTIHVANPNLFAVSGVDVGDAVDNGGSCAVTGGSDLTIAGSSTVDLPYTCTYGAAPSSSGGTNTATATWLEGASQHSGSGFAAFDFATATPTIVEGSVSVSDTLGGSLGTVSSTDPSPTSITYPYTFSGDPGGTCTTHDNTATFTTSDTLATGSSGQTVRVCVGKDLAVSKDATPAFQRTYKWGIKKDVDKTLVGQIGGGTATFNYTVSVTHDNGTDGAWKVTGKIHVANPNDWEAITANVTDAIGNGGSCSVTGGSNVSIPAGGSVDLSYTCTYSSAPSPPSGTNTGTATWNAGTYATPDGSASGTATANFGSVNPTLIDDCVTVTDTFNGTPTTLGNLCRTDSSPKTYTYSHTVNVPAHNCITYNNTARFTTNTTGTTGTAPRSVEVCGPAQTGALTMGFWQNKTGQGIITGGASISGVCKSGTWLRQYAPFQDLSATATCSQVATYVYNVIKAAVCTSPTNTCNLMLKAQILATALDVYFSDPALGANKINAPAAIGGKSIDLTKICHMIDASGGTATCSGSFENVGSAFGGATSMTVGQMLAYAAGQSNVGGTSWYVQVKATQVLAKDAFDAINNQVAFSP